MREEAQDPGTANIAEKRKKRRDVESKRAHRAGVTSTKSSELLADELATAGVGINLASGAIFNVLVIVYGCRVNVLM